MAIRRHPDLRRWPLNFEDAFTNLDVWRHLVAGIAGMTRLFVLTMMAPFFGSQVVSGQLRTALVFSLYLAVHPLVLAQMPVELPLDLAETFVLALVLFKEALLGLCLGWLAGIPFWAAESGGFLIDNQRGASMSETSDAYSGDDTSPLGVLFLQSTVYLFFVSGAFLAFMGFVWASYLVWPVGSFSPAIGIDAALFFAGEVNWLMLHMLLLAGPIAAACLLADLSLGLMNRFAPQLNVYVMAMPIKSALAGLILLAYFGILSANAPWFFGHLEEALARLRDLMP
jgi:type III secretion protein T